MKTEQAMFGILLVPLGIGLFTAAATSSFGLKVTLIALLTAVGIVGARRRDRRHLRTSRTRRVRLMD